MIKLVTHRRPDGDALGAVFAARELITRAGNPATVHLFGDLPRWFPAVHRLLGEPPYETSPVVEGPVWLFDASTLARCGEGNVAEGLDLAVLADHHPDEGTPAAARYISPEMSSTCEMLARRRLIFWHAPLTPNAAGWLYLGLRTDSLAFATSTTTVYTHEVAAQLIDDGAPHLAITQAVHRSLTRQHLGFQSWVLANAVWAGDAMVCAADRATRQRFGVSTGDAKMIFGPAGQLTDVGLVALVKEADDGRTLVSLRSPGSGRAQALARHFGGGGHPSAAGAAVSRPLWEVHGELLVLLAAQGVA